MKESTRHAISAFMRGWIGSFLVALLGGHVNQIGRCRLVCGAHGVHETHHS